MNNNQLLFSLLLAPSFLSRLRNLFPRNWFTQKKNIFWGVFVNLVLSDRVAQCTNFFLISFLPFFVLIFFYGFDLKKKKGWRRADTPMETNKSFQEWVGGIWNLKMYIHSREPFLQFRSSSVEKNKDVYRLYTCIYSPTCTWALRNFLILFFDFISFWSQKGKMEEAGFYFHGLGDFHVKRQSKRIRPPDG
jgi:hypothetical protein